jgi:hypothetical protein
MRRKKKKDMSACVATRPPSPSPATADNRRHQRHCAPVRCLRVRNTPARARPDPPRRRRRTRACERICRPPAHGCAPTRTLCATLCDAPGSAAARVPPWALSHLFRSRALTRARLAPVSRRSDGPADVAVAVCAARAPAARTSGRHAHALRASAYRVTCTADSDIARRLVRAASPALRVQIYTAARPPAPAFPANADRRRRVPASTRPSADVTADVHARPPGPARALSIECSRRRRRAAADALSPSPDTCFSNISLRRALGRPCRRRRCRLRGARASSSGFGPSRSRALLSTHQTAVSVCGDTRPPAPDAGAMARARRRRLPCQREQTPTRPHTPVPTSPPTYTHAGAGCACAPWTCASAEYVGARPLTPSCRSTRTP